MLITYEEVSCALGLLRNSKRFDATANRIGFGLRFRLRAYRATGLRLFTRRTVARLLASETTR
jgi:hypothetical protein